ncbi:MAG TPA: hypothetical protein VI198_01620, partial [Candidatus Eisenbacteria bacterium]
MNGARTNTLDRPAKSAGDRPVGAAGFWRFLLSELKPKGSLFTPFNLVSVPIMIAAAVILYIRFTQGLSAVTNLS